MGKRLLPIVVVSLIASAIVSMPATYADPNPPSEQDIQRSKDKEKQISSTISQTEVELARINAKRDQARQEAQNAREAYQVATEQMNEAIESAIEAQENFEESQRQIADAHAKLGQVGSALYKLGASNISGFSALFSVDSLTTAAQLQTLHEIAGKHQNAQVENFEALSQISNLLKNKASQAAQKATDIAQEAENAAKIADEKEAAAVQIVNDTQTQREQLIAQLAQQKGTTAALEKARQDYLEEMRRKAEEERRRKREEERRRKLEQERQRRIAAAKAAAAKQSQLEKSISKRARSGSNSGWVRPAGMPDGMNVGGSVDLASLGSGAGAEVVKYAVKFSGVPYVWGGTSSVHGWDCSGFTQFVYGHFGIRLPKYSGDQRRMGRVVPRSQARPGDIMWWPGHVGIYAGGNMHIAAHNPAMGTGIRTIWGNPIYLRLFD